MIQVKKLHKRGCVCTQQSVFVQKTCVSEINCVTLHPIFIVRRMAYIIINTKKEKNHVRN
jgi:hypothetical protein